MSLFLRCLLGPRLYGFYARTFANEQQGYSYLEGYLEYWGDTIVKIASFSVSMAMSLGFYSSAFAATYLYRRGFFTVENLTHYVTCFAWLGMLVFVSFGLRGFGRWTNVHYVDFINALEAFNNDPTSKKLKDEVSKYDFQFSQWPVEFRWNFSKIDADRPKIYIENTEYDNYSTWKSIQNIPLKLISYISIHTFGRRLIYPGSTKLIHLLLGPFLHTGRAKLIESCGGERFKLLARDGNKIDSLFIDRRNKESFPNGSTLVICCEGNCAFYECGITATPIEGGYSVLGWNHPGFFGSTGEPYPDQETNAIDVVMQFAIHKLRFKVEDIVVYAWSIGGFTGTWAAMNYPHIKGLVLDATFDDLVPLAVVRMLPVLKSIVVSTIRNYMNLDNAAQLCKYNGPVVMIRRTRDEILSTQPSRSMSTNRGNDLLRRLLHCRYPNLFTSETEDALTDWLTTDRGGQAELFSEVQELAEASILSYISNYSSEFPLNIGEGEDNAFKTKLLFYLAHKHMIDFNSTHSVSLPVRYFQMPWSPCNLIKKSSL